MRLLQSVKKLMLLLGLFGPFFMAPVRAGQNPPNIIFLLTDDQRWDALGCMGNKILKTPAIDRLSAQGVTFDNMFCTTSICAVSRACFMTGQYARRHGINDFRTPYSPRQLAESFPLQLRKHGYRTGLIGKWGIGGKLPEDQYDYWKGFPGQSRYFPKGKKGASQHLTEIMRNQSLEFLDGCKPGQPFLLQLYSKAAHCQDGDSWPFQPDPRYNNLYADVEIPKPLTATEAHYAQLPAFLKTSEARKRWHVRFETPELYQKSVRDYYRLITGIDDTVAAIRAKLTERGFADNTVFIYTSDNGFYLGDRGLAGKWFIHEESIRLPLIIHDPRLSKKQWETRRDQMVLNIDIAPTIFELAGLAPPASIQGKSLVPLLRGGTPLWREEFLYEHRVDIKTLPQSEGVRTKRWKYVRYVDTNPLYEELYDLQTDPFEEVNLAGNEKHKSMLIEMRKKLVDHIAKAK